MKQLKIPFIIFVLAFTTLSCTKSYEKKVYFNLGVGGSKANADKFYEKFRLENNPNRSSKYPYYKHTLSFGGNYYSSPLYLYAPNDTIVHTVDIYYFINPKDGDDVIETTREGLLRMTVDDNYNNINPKLIFDDVKKEIESKYGKAESTDTLIYKKPYHIINTWKNKDGINIILDYAYSQEVFVEQVKYYNLKLEFTLTDELKSKLIKNKSIY